MTGQSFPRVPTSASSRSARRFGVSLISYRKSSNNWKEGQEIAIADAASMSRRERASATTLAAPDLNSTQKSNPSNLLTDWC
jgi:hypothetical protein